MILNINYELHGCGPPIIMLHGLFGSARNWRGMAKQMGETFSVYAPDARNHGESEHCNSMSYPEMADDLAGFIKEHNLGRVSIIGHSMGGKTAMCFALRHEALIDKLIIMDIAPCRYENDYLPLIESMQNLDCDAIRSRSEANEILSAKIPDPTLRLFLLQNLVKNDNVYQWRINLEALKNNLENIAGFPESDQRTVAKEALFLAGEHSDYIQASHHSLIESVFSSSTIRVISDAAHWLHADQPLQVYQAINGFLSDQP